MAHLTLSCLVAALLLCSFVNANTVSVTTNATSIAENGGFALVTFRQSDTSLTTVVEFSVAGSAVLNKDYTQSGANSFGVTPSITIPAGQTSATVLIAAIDNTLVDLDRTVSLTLKDGGALYSVGTPSSVSITIVNDDIANVTIAVVGPTTITEGDGQMFVFQFTRNMSLLLPLSVTFSIGGSSTYGDDWVFAANNVTVASNNITAVVVFAANSSTANVFVRVIDDLIGEQPETITLVLQPGASYQPVSPSLAQVTILSNDVDSVSLRVSPSSVLEDAGVPLVFTLTRAGSVGSQSLSVNVTLSGAFNLGGDLTVSGVTLNGALAGTVTFATNEATKTIVVTPVANRVLDSDKLVTLTVLNSSSVPVLYTVLPPASVVGRILNDDAQLTAAVSPTSVPLSVSTNMNFTVTRTGYIGSALTVSFTLAGTAVYNTDYTATNFVTLSGSTGTLTIPANSATGFLLVTSRASTTIGADLTIVFTVATSDQYLVGAPNSVTGTIRNDNLYIVNINAAPSAVLEDSGTPMVVTLSRTGDAALTVSFSLSGTTTPPGQAASDYILSGATLIGTTGSITIPQGTSSVSFTVVPIRDTVFEADETVIITVLDGVGYKAGTPPSVTLTILNDDTGSNRIGVVVDPASVAEESGSSLTFTFTRSGAGGAPYTINFQLRGSALLFTDYNIVGALTATQTSGSVAIAANELTTKIVVTPIDNDVLDPPRTVIVIVAPATNSEYTVDPLAATATGTITDSDKVTVDTLESPLSTLGGFAVANFKFPMSLKPSTSDLRVDISNYLGIPSRYVDVFENSLQNVAVKIYNIAGGENGDPMMQRLVIAVNTPDPLLIGTSLYGATGFWGQASYATQERVVITRPPIAINITTPRPRPATMGNQNGDYAGNAYYLPDIIVVGGAAVVLPAAVLSAIIAVLIAVVVA